jgi:hypothetical protein
MRTDEPFARAVITAAAITGAILMSAPGAQGAPKSQVQTDCEKAGGNYVLNSASSESCCFEEALDDEDHHCKEYIAGEYVGVSRVVDFGSEPGAPQLVPPSVLRPNR